MRKPFRIVAVLTFVVTSPGFAAAQSTPDWARKVKPGKSIFVMTTDGVQIDGVAGPVTPEGLTIYTPAGRETISFERAFRVERRDSSKTGLLYGAVGGYVSGLVFAANEGGCDGPWMPGFCSAGFTQMMSLMTGGIGALIGWGIDAAERGRSKIYEAAPPVKVGVVAGPRGAGVRVTW